MSLIHMSVQSQSGQGNRTCVISKQNMGYQRHRDICGEGHTDGEGVGDREDMLQKSLLFYKLIKFGLRDMSSD